MRVNVQSLLTVGFISTICCQANAQTKYKVETIPASGRLQGENVVSVTRNASGHLTYHFDNGNRFTFSEADPHMSSMMFERMRATIKKSSGE